MGKTNGKSNIEPEELDVGHELPPSEEASGEPPEVGTAKAKTATTGGEDTATFQAELQKAQVERDMLLDRLARLQAEFENARKRGAREQQEYREYALADAVKTLLPILDSFERALHTASPEAAEFRGGVELIYKQLHDALVKLGLRAIPATGEPFDPRLHQAIEMVETTAAEDHQVLEELQRGYKLKDRLLRPAMVKVAKNPKR